MGGDDGVERSRCLVRTIDGTLEKVTVRPKCRKSKVTFRLEYYPPDQDTLCPGKLVFSKTAAMDFEVNFFENPIGAELGSFFEIYDEAEKRSMVERLFQNRKSCYMSTGDYTGYDPEDPSDILNFRATVEELLSCLADYHLYQLETMGGIFRILAKEYTLTTE